MKPIFHEVKPVNGILTMSDPQINEILDLNSIRAKPVNRDQITASLESLRKIYAEHTGMKINPVRTSEHAPCMGLDGRCGSTDFMRTGTCFVCLNCQTSQGCS